MMYAIVSHLIHFYLIASLLCLLLSKQQGHSLYWNSYITNSFVSDLIQQLNICQNNFFWISSIRRVWRSSIDINFAYNAVVVITMICSAHFNISTFHRQTDQETIQVQVQLQGQKCQVFEQNGEERKETCEANKVCLSEEGRQI